MPRSIHGWKQQYAFDRPRIARAVAPPPSAEEIERRRVQSAALMERMLAEIAATSGLGKVADREARVAVEGDTDLNHDNIEAAK